MKQAWRLIPPLAASGRLQMAVDRWLLHQHQQGHSPPVLRFYTWIPAAISLGYHQRRWPTHWNTLVWQGQPLDLVRRPSGGRAVLHAGDLTYALITSGWRGTRLQVYQRACQFLLQGFESLQVPLLFGQAGRGYIHNPSCFGTATGADLVWTGDPTQKLVGSAQFWSDGCLLQHGSIRLAVPADLYCLVFGEPGQGVGPLAVKLSPLSLNQQQDAVVTALVEAAEGCLDACFETIPLTDTEIHQAVEQFSLPV